MNVDLVLTDFDKWADEDEQDGAEDVNFVAFHTSYAHADV